MDVEHGILAKSDKVSEGAHHHFQSCKWLPIGPCDVQFARHGFLFLNNRFVEAEIEPIAIDFGLSIFGFVAS